MSTTVTVIERGNGFPRIGDYVLANDGNVFRVVDMGRGAILTGDVRGNRIEGVTVERIDHYDDAVHSCAAELE